MKYLLLSTLLLAGCFSSSGQGTNTIVIGKVDTIQSTILNEKRTIWVYVPHRSTENKQKYPVVYLLDGESHFSSVVGMIEQLASMNGNSICPEMIVVGIVNTDRTRDLTPTHVDNDPPYMDSASIKTSGGGERFISFIEKELMPRIDAQYPTAPYKTLIGHSFGGLTVMQTLIHHPGLFNAYICIDPSMWWDKQTLLKEAKKTLADRRFRATSLFLGIANTMEDGMNVTDVVKDTSALTKHIRSILLLRTYFESNTQNGLRFQSKYYNEDEHNSVPLIAEYDGLHFLFNYYPFRFSFRDYLDTSGALVDKYEKHFEDISKKMGYKVMPSEDLINGMAYQALASRQYKKAERFFMYNIANYPQSFNVYDSMGDYYAAVGDKVNAVGYFRKALVIRDDAGTRQKMEKLQGTQ